MAIAIHYLSSHRLRLQSQGQTDLFFQIRINIAECTYRAAEFAHGDLASSAFQTFATMGLSEVIACSDMSAGLPVFVP